MFSYIMMWIGCKKADTILMSALTFQRFRRSEPLFHFKFFFKIYFIVIPVIELIL